MKKRIIISIVAVIIVVFVTGVGFWGFPLRGKIADEFSRFYYNFTRLEIGYLSIQTFAGCQPKTMMETKTDDQFSAEWEEESKRYHFDAIDVDRHMLNYCPPTTPEETINFWNEYLKDRDYPE